MGFPFKAGIGNPLETAPVPVERRLETLARYCLSLINNSHLVVAAYCSLQSGDQFAARNREKCCGQNELELDLLRLPYKQEAQLCSTRLRRPVLTQWFCSRRPSRRALGRPDMAALRLQLFLRVRARGPAAGGRRPLGRPIPETVQTKRRLRGPVLILPAGTNAPPIVNPLN